MLAALPLLALPVLLYNLLAALAGGYAGTETATRLPATLFHVPMTSHAPWAVSLGDLFLGGSLVALFLELMKARMSHGVAIANHALSLILFIGCLVEFLIFPAFATSTFFLITLMVLLDVLAGFIATFAGLKRGNVATEA